jgi:hypothetical protein
MRNFPDLIEAYLDFTSGHEGTQKLQKWSILSVLAAAMERKVWLDRGYYTLFPNLFVFIVGKSGLLKKSTSTAIAVNMLREIKGPKLMSERVTAAALIKQLQGAGRQFRFDGHVIRQSPLFIYASELAVFLEEVFGSIQELLTTFYDCQPNDSSKPWIYDTKTQQKTKIYGPCLNMLGATTKAWMRKCIPAQEMEGGFTSRVIFVIENEAPKNLVAWPAVDADARDKRSRIVEDLQQVAQMTGPMTPTDDARAVFKTWYEFHMREVIPGNHDPKFIGYYARKGDHILKLAMVRSAARSDDRIITAEDIRWAGKELEDLEPDLRAAFEGVGGNPVGEVLYEIRNYVRARRVVTHAELLKSFSKDIPGWQINALLKDLVQMGEIEEDQQPIDDVMVKCFRLPSLVGPLT